MSKKLIAGAGVVASFAIALAPLATFATVADADWNSDQHTDTWNVTVLPTCAFGAASATPVRGVDHNDASHHPEDVGGSDNAATWAATNNNSGTGNDGVYSNNLGAMPDMADVVDDQSTDEDETFTTAKNESVSTASYSIYAGTADNNMGTTILKVVCNQNAGYKIKVTAANLRIGETSNYINVAETPSATATGYNITTTKAEGVTATLANVVSTSETTAVTAGQASAATGDAYTFTYGIGVAPGTTAGTYTGNVVYTLVQQLGS